MRIPRTPFAWLVGAAAAAVAILACTVRSGTPVDQTAGDFSILAAVLVAVGSCAAAARRGGDQAPAWIAVTLGTGCGGSARASTRPTV